MAAVFQALLSLHSGQRRRATRVLLPSWTGLSWCYAGFASRLRGLPIYGSAGKVRCDAARAVAGAHGAGLPGTGPGRTAGRALPVGGVVLRRQRRPHHRVDAARSESRGRAPCRARRLSARGQGGTFPQGGRARRAWRRCGAGTSIGTAWAVIALFTHRQLVNSGKHDGTIEFGG